MTVAAPPTPRVLRGYQRDAADAVEARWANGTRRTGVVLPTGSGKSTVIAELTRRAYHRGDGVVCLAHRGELLDQMSRELSVLDPGIDPGHLGIVRADADDHHCPVVYATLQTLASDRRLAALGRRAVVIGDECHHLAAPGFHRTLTDLGIYDHANLAGFTATMYRDGRGRIGLGDIIESVAFERDIAWAIREGYLVAPRGLTVRIAGLDALDDVRTVAGDFHQGDMADVMEAATQYVVEAVTEHAADRRPIVFAASVDAAHTIADALTDAGYPAAAVTGAMPYAARLPVYAAFRAGDVRALVTVQVLTEGADFPMCDTVVLARPTRSRNLYAQMVGRALRLHPGKVDALVLDLAGSSRHMRLVTLTQLVPGAEQREADPDDEVDPMVDDTMPAGGGPSAREVRQGPVDMVSIDLLGAADDTLWLETPKGVPFLPLMSSPEVVFLWPAGGWAPGREGPDGHDIDAVTTTWSVGQINTRTRRGQMLTPTGVALTLASAVGNAEDWVTDGLHQRLPARWQSWRRNQPPSDAQLGLARSMGIVGCADMTKARLSDEISVRKAAAVLDHGIEN